MNLKKITPTIRRTAALILFLVLANIIFLWHGPRSDHPRVGSRATQDIIAPYTFPIPKDPKTIEQEETQARNTIPPVLDIFVPPVPNALVVVPSATKQVLESPAGPSIRSRAQSRVKKIQGQGYWPEKNITPITSPWVTIRTATTEFKEFEENLIGRNEAETILQSEAQKLYPQNENLQSAFYYTAFSLLTPTFSYNRQETEARRQAAARAVERNKGLVVKGERIVAEREKVTPEIAEKLKALEATKLRTNFILRLAGTTLLLIIILVSGGLYCRVRKPKVWRDELTLYLILTLGIVTLAVGKVVGLISVYLTPLGIAALLLTLLLDLEVATLFVLLASVGLGFMAGGDFSLFLFMFTGAMVGSYTALKIRRRSKFYYGAVALAAGYLIALATMAFFHQNFSLETAKLVGYALLNSIISAAGVILLLPVLERFFGLVSNLTLNDLVDLNRPLFQRMVIEAPGTYHHSIVIANLAEAAAVAIRANPVLARAGGYLHDIGKLKKPDYFIENLSGKRNPHDKLTPKMSSLIIGAHVKDGLELARKERLPQPIQEIIAQHHGTTIMETFFEKAERLKANAADYEFRYPGPKPRSKEAALVMIADAVEATARAERRISASRLKKVIKGTTEERFADGQFDNCALTRQELVKIQESLYPILLGVFHPRVRYPKDEDRDLRPRNSSPR